MRSRWNEHEAAAAAGDPLAMRVYVSRLLGADEDLVMHGGGNTSVKATQADFFGDPVEVLLVKGSGWDLATIEPAGFPALRLEPTRRLAELEELSDLDMTRQLRSFMLDPGGPAPSVEAILHAVLPPRFVDHTHADAVVTLSNTPDGERLIRELYPDCLVLPYVMPGFVLSKQVHEAIRGVDLEQYRGIILLHHGVFTCSDDPRESYERMIELVDRAERFLAERSQWPAIAGAGDEPRDEPRDEPGDEPADPPAEDLRTLARIRQAVSRVRGRPQLARLDASDDAWTWASRPDVAAIATRGPITPDHVIRTKRVPVIVDTEPADGVPEVAAFAEAYAAEFNALGGPDLRMLDPAPLAAVWRYRGTIAFGSTPGECRIIDDLARHTRRAITAAEPLGGWTALSPREIFELEYWSLEQAKLANAGGGDRPHLGRVALVTGAAGGIGAATCDALRAGGAVVVGIDRDPAVLKRLAGHDAIGIVGDVTDPEAVAAAVRRTVARFGGLDILVANAGIFRTGERIEEMSEDTWGRTLEVNLTSVRRLLAAAIPYLRHGVDPTVLMVGSRNVAAPGPAAAAYSVSKAGLVQLARVAALELAADGIRVNLVHPDAVFDTGVWTPEALERSAARYGLSVDEYKTRNLLRTTITAADVARLLSVMAGPAFRATTGAQVPIDGGNDRVL